MSTVLESALSFVGTSVAGGVTWDILKGRGLHLYDCFQKRFKNPVYFQTNEEIESFIEDINSKEIYNVKSPFKDVESIYEKCTDKENKGNFIKDFKEWLTLYKNEFGMISENIVSQSATININGTVSATHGGKIEIAGNIAKF